MKKSFLLCACLVVMAFTLTACGEKNNPETTGTTTGSSTEGSSSTENGNNSNGTGSVGKDLGNMIDDAGDVVDDAAKDVSDALTGSYDTYDHAYKYFMDQIPGNSKNYEVRNNDKDLTDYNSGSMGYHFELHDTRKSDNSKVGDFYVDSTSGKVYKAVSGSGVSEFDFSTLK